MANGHYTEYAEAAERENVILRARIKKFEALIERLKLDLNFEWPSNGFSEPDFSDPNDEI